MDYREQPPPAELRGLVKVFWSLDAGGQAGQWLRQQATPDGCVEIIRRTRGRSRWNREQPESFAVGLIDAPAGFEVSGDSVFAAVRVWPWAWSLLSPEPLDGFRNAWRPFGHPILAALPDLAAAASLVPTSEGLAATGRSILGAASVAEMSLATGLRPRSLQRWFSRHVGLAPRRYLQLLRFQSAFEAVGIADDLAGHAAERGFADQAHMARAFRALAGVPPREARRTARCPFLPGEPTE